MERGEGARCVVSERVHCCGTKDGRKVGEGERAIYFSSGGIFVPTPNFSFSSGDDDRTMGKTQYKENVRSHEGQAENRRTKDAFS